MVMRVYAQELRYGKIEDFIGKPLVLFLLRNSYFVIGTLLVLLTSGCLLIYAFYPPALLGAVRMSP
jgi:hypothetical protein